MLLSTMCLPEDYSISSRAFTLLTRFRLGMPLDAVEHRVCPGCSCDMEEFGDHVICCKNMGIYARHNSLRNKFAALCKGLQLQVEVEEHPEGSRRRPADVLVSGLDAGLPLAVDFAVVYPEKATVTERFALKNPYHRSSLDRHDAPQRRAAFPNGIALKA